MILPDKHLDIPRSMLGMGGTLLAELGEPTSVTALWDRVHRRPEQASFEEFSLALSFLYAIGLVEFSRGLLCPKRP